MKLKNVLIGGAIAIATAVGGVALPANAAGNDGVANANEIFFYYSQGLANSRWDWDNETSNFYAGGIVGLPFNFITAGAGQGSAVRNAAASVRNGRGQGGRVYFSSNFAGVSDYVPGVNWINLSPTLRNDNASFRWV